VIRVELLEQARREFAEKIRAMSALRSTRLVDALGSIPRERFLGPGPWQILRLAEAMRGYEFTPDDDPRHLYDNVLVALDASRNLNNGEPAFLLRCLDDLDLSPRDRFLHVGCGVGYYTAVAAVTVAPGTVVGIELDAQLAARARQNLRHWPNVTVLEGDGSEFVSQPFDAIFVNAGASEPLPSWLDQLRMGGRLLVPMTVDLPTPWCGLGTGHMLLVTRHSDLFSARFTSSVGVFHCAGARTINGVNLLRQAYLRGGHDRVRSLRRDEHPSSPQCWLHAPRFCLSYVGADR
jgi:protein-L-isoaspartate(D-aspartate) O-methyltransferase